MKPAISLSTVAEGLSKSRREELLSAYDLKEFAKIFEDESMLATADTSLAVLYIKIVIIMLVYCPDRPLVEAASA